MKNRLLLLLSLIGSQTVFAGGGLNGLKGLAVMILTITIIVILLISSIVAAIVRKNKLLAFFISVLSCLGIIGLWVLYNSL